MVADVVLHDPNAAKKEILLVLHAMWCVEMDVLGIVVDDYHFPLVSVEDPAQSKKYLREFIRCH